MYKFKTKKYINQRILCFAFLIGLFSALAYQIINYNILHVSINQISEYNRKIAEEELYIGELKKKIGSLEEQINLHNGSFSTGRKKIEEYNAEISYYKKRAGFSPLVGEGVLILVDDGLKEVEEGSSPLDLVVHDVDVWKLITELNNAGAEAISINNTRIIVGLTNVLCNGPTIRINGIQQSRPFVIRAIGDKYLLSKKLLEHGSYGINLKSYGVQYDLVTKTKVYIPAYQGKREFKHSFIVED